MLKVTFSADAKDGTLVSMGIQIIVDNTDGQVLEADFEEKLEAELESLKSQILHSRALAMGNF